MAQDVVALFENENSQHKTGKVLRWLLAKKKHVVHGFVLRTRQIDVL